MHRGVTLYTCGVRLPRGGDPRIRAYASEGLYIATGSEFVANFTRDELPGLIPLLFDTHTR